MTRQPALADQRWSVEERAQKREGDGDRVATDELHRERRQTRNPSATGRDHRDRRRQVTFLGKMINDSPKATQRIEVHGERARGSREAHPSDVGVGGQAASEAQAMVRLTFLMDNPHPAWQLVDDAIAELRQRLKRS